MIPRGRPSYTLQELRAAIGCRSDEVERFERDLAAFFGRRYAIAFPYGRSAIYALLKARADAGAKVVQPAYNCAVVAHATVSAGCTPVFVDTGEQDPNQDPDRMVEAVDEHTAVAIPTSIFGLSFDAQTLCERIRDRNPRTLILMDCCQCFDSRWQGRLLAAEGDAAVLAFGIGKPMTTLFGGALLTDRTDLAEALRAFQRRQFHPPGRFKVWQRYGYFLASWMALSTPMVGITDWLEHAESPLRRYLLRLRSRERIAMPADNLTSMMAMEAAVGRRQLQRVREFIARRRWIGASYARQLADTGLDLLDWGAESSQAIYAARLAAGAGRTGFLERLHRAGVQGGAILDYVVPNLPCYRRIGFDGASFSRAMDWSKRVINLPNHPSLSDTQVAHIATVAQQAVERNG